MSLNLTSPSALAVGKSDLTEVGEVVVLVLSTCLRLAPVLRDTEEAAGVLTLPNPRVTAVEVDRRVDVAFEDPEDFFEIPDSRPDTIYMH